MNCKQVHQFDAIVIICLALTWGRKFAESPQFHCSLNFVQNFILFLIIIIIIPHHVFTSKLTLKSQTAQYIFEFVCVFVHVFMCL